MLNIFMSAIRGEIVAARTETARCKALDDQLSLYDVFFFFFLIMLCAFKFMWFYLYIIFAEACAPCRTSAALEEGVYRLG